MTTNRPSTEKHTCFDRIENFFGDISPKYTCLLEVNRKGDKGNWHQYFTKCSVEDQDKIIKHLTVERDECIKRRETYEKTVAEHGSHKHCAFHAPYYDKTHLPQLKSKIASLDIVISGMASQRHFSDNKLTF